MIVGDSLTSDILGGNNAGILTCWYNPGKAAKPDGYRVDYEIADLHEIYDLIPVSNEPSGCEADIWRMPQGC